MGVHWLALLLFVSIASCASGPAGTALSRNTKAEVVLKLGESQRLEDADLTMLFETVLEDSRCPKGTNCIWAGDARVRIRIEAADAPAATHTLHTNDGFQREVIQGDWRIQLVSLTPEPTSDGAPRSDDYRATFLVQRK